LARRRDGAARIRRMTLSTQASASIDRAELEAYVDAAAAALGLAVVPAHRPGVLAAFQLAARCAALVNEQALRPEDEAAPLFAPLGPGDAPLPDRRRR
jgi:hypothetical protein